MGRNAELISFSVWINFLTRDRAMSLKRSSGQAENQFQKGYVFERESRMLWLISFNLGLKLPYVFDQSKE